MTLTVIVLNKFVIIILIIKNHSIGQHIFSNMRKCHSWPFWCIRRQISDVAESRQEIRQNVVSKSFEVIKRQNSQKGQILIFF